MSCIPKFVWNCTSNDINYYNNVHRYLDIEHADCGSQNLSELLRSKVKHYTVTSDSVAVFSITLYVTQKHDKR